MYDSFGPKGGTRYTGVGENCFRVVGIDERRIIVDSDPILAPLGLFVNPLNVDFRRRFLVSDTTVMVGTVSRDGGTGVWLRRVSERPGR